MGCLYCGDTDPKIFICHSSCWAENLRPEQKKLLDKIGDNLNKLSKCAKKEFKDIQNQKTKKKESYTKTTYFNPVSNQTMEIIRASKHLFYIRINKEKWTAKCMAFTYGFNLVNIKKIKKLPKIITSSGK